MTKTQTLYSDSKYFAAVMYSGSLIVIRTGFAGTHNTKRILGESAGRLIAAIQTSASIEDTHSLLDTITL